MEGRFAYARSVTRDSTHSISELQAVPDHEPCINHHLSKSCISQTHVTTNLIGFDSEDVPPAKHQGMIFWHGSNQLFDLLGFDEVAVSAGAGFFVAVAILAKHWVHFTSVTRLYPASPIKQSLVNFSLLWRDSCVIDCHALDLDDGFVLLVG